MMAKHGVTFPGCGPIGRPPGPSKICLALSQSGQVTPGLAIKPSLVVLIRHLTRSPTRRLAVAGDQKSVGLPFGLDVALIVTVFARSGRGPVVSRFARVAIASVP